MTSFHKKLLSAMEAIDVHSHDKMFCKFPTSLKDQSKMGRKLEAGVKSGIKQPIVSPDPAVISFN
jgi:hypothetical protein